MPPSIGETGIVEITHFSSTGNAHVQLNDEDHLNIGCIDCDVGDSIEVKRLDEIFCECLHESLHPDNYRFRLSRMRKHHDKIDSDKNKIDVDYKPKSGGQRSEITSPNTSINSGSNPLSGEARGDKNGLINGPM